MVHFARPMRNALSEVRTFAMDREILGVAKRSRNSLNCDPRSHET